MTKLHLNRCCLCDARGWETLDLCRSCYEELPENNAACGYCAIPLRGAGTDSAGICGHCLNQPPPIDKAFSPYLYDYPVDYFVQSLKFAGLQKYARLMGELMARRLSAENEDALPQALIPVPLHKNRFRERGFNQSVLIAQYCGKKLSLPVLKRHIVRAIDNPPQSGLSKPKRKDNIRNAFVMANRTQHDHIALVDDVMTTGNTLFEIARLLRKNGFSRVDAWVFARTP